VARRNRRVDGLVIGNSLATTRECGVGEDLGEERPDRWVPAVSIGGVVTGGRPGSHVEMGRGVVEAGRCKGKRPVKLFLFGIPFPFKFLIWGENKLGRNT
jgi:hypothetical protein